MSGIQNIGRVGVGLLGVAGTVFFGTGTAIFTTGLIQALVMKISPSKWWDWEAQRAKDNLEKSIAPLIVFDATFATLTALSYKVSRAAWGSLLF